MKTKSLMVLALIALFIGMGTSAYAVTITPVISADALGTDVITTVAPGQRFFVNVQVSDATGIAGAALTLTYDKTLFDVIGKDGVAASGADEIARTTYSGDTTGSSNSNVILESDTFLNMSDSPTAPTQTMTLRTGKIDTANGKIMFSGAFIDRTTGAAPVITSTSNVKNLFRIRLKVKAGVTTGTGTFGLEKTVLDNKNAGWGPNATPVNDGKVPALVGAVAKFNPAGSTTVDPNFTDATKAFSAIASNLDTANATATLAVQGAPGVVRPGATDAKPTLGDVIYFYNHYKCLSNPSASGCTSVKVLAGNGDFSHNGGIDLGDVLMLFYYYKGQPPAANPTLE